jgi:S1-C subfamily serine protease
MRRRFIRTLLAMVALLLVLSGCASQKPSELRPEQKMVELAKPAVVRPVTVVDAVLSFTDKRVVAAVGGKNPLQLGFTITGSGWFISSDGYVVTNAHVASVARMKDDELLQNEILPMLVKYISENLGVKLTNDDIALLVRSTQVVKVDRQFFVLTPGGDKLGAEIKSFGVPIGDDVSGKDVAVLKVEGKNFPTLPPGDSDKLVTQDKVFVMGYPGNADFMGLFDDKSVLEVTVSDGAVQAKKNTAQGTPVIQTGATAAHGNSGGPVLNEKGQVIGILTFGKSDTMNFVVPMNTIQEFVRQAGAVPSDSETNARFKESMELYWNGHYSKAIPKYESTLRLYGSHAEAKKYLSDAEQRRKTEPAVDLSDPLVLGVIGGGVLLIVVAIGLVFMLRRQKSGAADQKPAAPKAAGVTPPPAKRAAEPQFAGGTTVLTAGPGHIRFTGGPLAGQQFAVPAEGLLLGREPGEGILAVPDSRVSRQHCWIGSNGTSGVKVVDRGSTNGTYVNTIGAGRVSEVVLHPGDVVYLAGDGAIAFVYEG